MLRSERVVNTPVRGIGERTLDEVRHLARTQGLALWDAAMACTQSTTLTARARNALASFLNLLQQLALETNQMDLAERIDHMLQRSELRQHWKKEARGSLDAESRQENLDELVSVASRFCPSAKRRRHTHHDRIRRVPILRVPGKW